MSTVVMTPIIRQNLSICQGIAVDAKGRSIKILPYNYGMDLANRLKVLGQAIRGARLVKKMTQGDVSEVTRLSVGYLSNLENGYVNPKRGSVVPSDETLAALSAAVDLPIGFFHEVLGRTGQVGTSYIADPDAALLVERYTNAPDRDRKIVDALLGLGEENPSEVESAALRASRRGSIGGRCSDD